MDTEKTMLDGANRVIDNESTRLDSGFTGNEVRNESVAAPDVNESKGGGSFFKKAAVGAGAGILVGSLSSFVGVNAMAAEVEDDNELIMPEGEDVVEPIDTWSDGGVDVATTVNNEMSFGEAFAAARAEVGSGGAFEWRGNVYSTYTAEEWNSMSEEEIEEYNSHFAWSGTDDGNTIPENIAGSDNGEIIEDAEIEVLGLIHDSDSGYDIGSMLVDDQEVYLVDVDPAYGNGEFDYMFSDVNGDGQITDDEIYDISDQNVDVDTFANMASSNIDGLS